MLWENANAGESSGTAAGNKENAKKNAVQLLCIINTKSAVGRFGMEDRI